MGHSLLNCSLALLHVSWSQENSPVYSQLYREDFVKLVPEQMKLCG